ncbi:phosphotransferase family protein [Paenibacillus physcomitrellae]|uniref:Aminoglycoside phosphotransferase n=1 Tax=Paenibacillus physcomitrellae TaxID=1619311 RepID=A0ABQ1FML4_9BACL|nr:phosphotransferase [Paenibacillus physcomitrellae]GGA20042.1 aminoglycoside phosphotransferase [Paenibacillus physcomitrellae]
MKSATKAELTEEQLQKLIRHIFDEQTVIHHSQELEDGWFNAAYRITLRSSREGKTVILKVGPPQGAHCMRYERNMMNAEVKALLKLREAGVPVPEVYGYDPSRTLALSEYFVMECLTGEPFNKIKEQLPREQAEQVQRELGRINRAINGIAGTQFGYLANPESRSGDWAECFLNMVEGLLLDAADVGCELPAEADEIRRTFERGRASLSEVKEPRLVHWDLWDGNVFVDDGRITGIIDCERALWGDPLMEYYFRSIVDSQAFLEGYGPLPETPGSVKRKRMYDMYLNLIFHIECVFRQFDNEGHIDWARTNLWKDWPSFQLVMEQQP